jgi:hypothetical protein
MENAQKNDEQPIFPSKAFLDLFQKKLFPFLGKRAAPAMRKTVGLSHIT